MAFHCYAVLHYCTICSKNKDKPRKYSKTVMLFPTRASLEFLATNILGDLILTTRKNRYLLAITDLFSKLVRTEPLKRITAAAVAQTFATH